METVKIVDDSTENKEVISEINENEVIDCLPPLKKHKNVSETTETKSDSPIQIGTTPVMSKRQKKKLIKLEKWEIKKKIKRLEEREKYKQKRQKALAQGEPTRIGPSRKELKRKQLELIKNDNENQLKLVVDLDFDDLMTDRDICKCVKQLLRIYTINRRSAEPGKLYFVGIKENGKIHKCLEKNDGYENWNVKWEFNKTYTDMFSNNEEIIYLSSDSDNVLDKYDPNCVYIIGGIVDHNHHKGLCFDRAQKLNIKTARLPLNEHVHIKTRTVLSTVHVFEMLLSVSQGKSWKETILNILPLRKGAKPLEEYKTGTAEEEENLTIIESCTDDVKTNEIFES